MLSEFQKLFETARPLLMAMHAVRVPFCYDYREPEPLWLTLFATLELNRSDSDSSRSMRGGSDNSRQLGAFLIDRSSFSLDSSGNRMMPGEYSAVQHDGWLWRASAAEKGTIWTPEDHEGRVIRFNTVQHEALS